MISLVLKRSSDIKEWIPGFGTGKKEEKGGNSRESYRYKIYMLLPFLLFFSFPLLFADSCWDTSHHLCRFSVIPSRICNPFVLLDS